MDNVANGITYQGAVKANFVTWYSFQSNAAFSTLPMVITLDTPAGASARLVVAPHEMTSRPSPSYNAWQSSSGSLTIQPTDPNYAKSSRIIIGVYGFSSVSAFSLSIAVGVAVPAINGAPIEDSTEQGVVKYYSYVFTPDRWNQTLTIIVNFKFGSGGLWGAFDTTRPDQNHYKYYDNSGNYRRIIVQPQEVKAVGSVFYFSFGGNTQDRVSYTISATSGDSTSFCFGQPTVVAVSQNRPAYLSTKLEPLALAQDISANTQAAGSNYAQLYASYRATRPSSQAFAWQSFGPSGLSIPAADLRAETLNFGVWPSSSLAKTFTFVTGPSKAPVQLLNGTSVSGSLTQAGQAAYYAVQVAQFQTLTITMTFRVGTAWLVASNKNVWPASSCASPVWSDNSGNYRRVIIKPSDSSYTPGTYYVNVVSTSAVVYDVVATLNGLSKN